MNSNGRSPANYFQTSSRGLKLIEKYAERSSGYLLLYFSEDKTNGVLPRSSTLLPNDFSYDTCAVEEKVLLKPDIPAQIFAKSANQKEMNMFKTRMERRLDEAEMNVSKDSYELFSHTVW